MEDYKHLRISKAVLQNPRRKQKPGMSPTVRSNIPQHAAMLTKQLQDSIKTAKEQPATKAGSYVLKFNLASSFSIAGLRAQGVEFISQEGSEIYIGFIDELGLNTFTERLSMLGAGTEGLTYKSLLLAIDNIGNWTAEDRKSWALKRFGLPKTDSFKLDVELWPISQTGRPEKENLTDSFEQWLNSQGIKKLDRVSRESLLMYRLELTIEQANQLLNHADVRCIDLMPSSGISYQKKDLPLEKIPHIQQPAEEAARICILDSGVNSGHPLLQAAMGEGVNFTNRKTEMDETGHGTAVAGIALYGNLEENIQADYWKPELWLLSGKILNDKNEFDEKTIENTITEAVEYFVENHNCKIFNLSIGNANAPYQGGHVQGIAYVLDTLARKHDVLFIVSAGNFIGCDDPAVPQHSWRDEYPEYLLHEQSIILDPAPALNVLTVGSLVLHDYTANAQKHPSDLEELAAARENQPSPFTRHGPSVRGAIKPELMAYGGNSAIAVRGQHWKAADKGLGILSCNHGFIGNTLLSETCGTSFSTPYITHLAGRLLNNYPDASANLLRALLVNQAQMLNEISSTFPEELAKAYKTKNRSDIVHDVAGYGKINESELFRSSESVVVMLAEEQIAENTSQFFELPLPEDFLQYRGGLREIRVSLAYMPPVRTTRMEYRATRIGFRLVDGDSLQEVERHFDNETKAEYQTMSESSTSTRFVSSELREKGTVQCSVWTRKQLNPNKKWFVVVTRNDHDWGQELCDELENYALVVTITDRENANAQLYTQIQQQINLQLRGRV